MFNGLDWAMLIAYLGIITGMGFWFSRENKAYDDYMFGGKNMPWFAIGISLIATSVSASTFLGNPAETLANNMTLLMLNLGSAIGVVIIAKVFIPRFRDLNVRSAYELLEQRFSRPVRLTAATFYACHITLRTGILLYGPALVLNGVFGINIFVAISLISVLAMVYTYFGGLKAVVWTDVMQFVILVGGGLAALYVCVDAAGGFSAMAAAAEEAGKTKWWDPSMDPKVAGNLLSAGLVYVVFEVAIRGCDQQFVQRYLACKDTKEANLSSYLSAGLGLGISILFYWVGAGLFVFYYIAKADSLPGDLGVNDIFPYFILHELPPGITGLLVAAIFAAAMSSLDSAISALSNTTMVDFLGYDPNKGDTIKKAKAWVLFWGVLGTLAAFLCVYGQKSLLTKALFFTSLFIGPLLGLFLLAFFFPKTKPKAVIIGAVCGMISLLPFSKFPFFSEYLWDPIYHFSWPWNPLISLTATLIASQLLTRIMGSRVAPAT